MFHSEQKCVLSKASWDMEQVHSGICELGQFVVFRCNLVQFNHILQCFFYWQRDKKYDCVSASEATLRDIGKYITRVGADDIPQRNKTQPHRVHVSFGMLYILTLRGLCNACSV